MKEGRRTGQDRSERRSAAIERVRKRDGREVPFDRTKIRDAIAAAMDAVGDDDPAFADEVAGVVELTLRDRAARADRADRAEASIPAIEEIQDLVERALMDLGRAAVAKAYILYRDRRARLRAALQVHERVRGPLRVRQSEGTSAWSKGRIVAALQAEAELSSSQAEEIAAAVERRVFASGWKRISTGLVRELVTSELFERGWTHALRGQEAIAVGRADLRRLLERGALCAWDEEEPAPAAARVLGGELLARWAQEELFGEELAELHHAGDLHVEDLRVCDRPLVFSIEAELLAGPADGAPWRLLSRVAELGPSVGRVLVLEDPAPFLAHLGVDDCQVWLEALASLARAAELRIDFSAPGRAGSAAHELPEPFLRSLAAVPQERAPRLYLNGHALEQELARSPSRSAMYEELLARGQLWPTWGDDEQTFVAPGCHRRSGERGAIACAGAVAFDLPRLARRAGAWREDLFQAGLTELVRAALEVARALTRFQARARRARAPQPFARASFALTPVGLREALLVLGDGELDPDQGARLLGLLSEAATRFADADTPSAVPTPFFGGRAARRFAWLDGRRAADEGGRQHWLFAEAEGAGEPLYSHGFALAPLAAGLVRGHAAGLAPGRLEAEVLRTLPAGACVPAALPAAPSAVRESEPCLEAWKRFECLRRAHSGEIEVELYPTVRAGRGARPATRSSWPREPRPAPLRPLR